MTIIIIDDRINKKFLLSMNLFYHMLLKKTFQFLYEINPLQINHCNEYD